MSPGLDTVERSAVPSSALGNNGTPRALTIAILAMGGEGGGVLADWIVDMAEHAGFLAQTTSVPGVAQRTGATIYYLELFPEAAARSAGKQPVLALMPVPGEVDVVIASELMEAGRAVQRGLVTPDRTTLIISTNRVYSMTEKMAIADGRVDSAALIESGRATAKRFIANDFASIAEQHRSLISAALFGALAATNALPFAREEFEHAIERGGVGVESSLAALDSAFAAAAKPKEEPPPTGGQRKVGPRLEKLAARVQEEFPPEAHDILLAGVERLADYQDPEYASEYLDRLTGIARLDSEHGGGRFELLRETGRYLALWMSYEDASRVADLKLRRTRFDRVGREARAGADQVVQIREFLHPGIVELTDTLPAALGQWLLDRSWIRGLVERLTKRGQIVQTTSLSGFLLLCLVAEQRRWRRRSLRYKREQAKMGEWLADITKTAPDDYALAVAVAEAARLLKGYGETYQRGRANFDAMMASLPKLRTMNGAAASQLRILCQAALADESGAKLADALQKLAA